MMKNNYFRYIYKRVIAGVLAGIVVFAASTLYMRKLYDISIESGLGGIESSLESYVTWYSQILFTKDSFIQTLSEYDVDFMRVVKVSEDGSYDTMFETDYNTIHVNSGPDLTYYITDDEHMPDKDNRTVLSEDSNTTVAYRKCDDLNEVVKGYNPAIASTAEVLKQSGAFSVGNPLFKLASDFNQDTRCPVLIVETSYADDEFLHLGKVYESTKKGEKNLFGKKWDFTDKDKEDYYTYNTADHVMFFSGSGGEPDGFSIKYVYAIDSNITCLNKRPDKFLADKEKLFFTKSRNDFYEYRSLDPAFNDFNADGFYSEKIEEGGGRTSYGVIKRVPAYGEEYIIEFIVTYVSFAEYFMPSLIVYAIVLLILCIGIPCLSGIGTYRLQKKTAIAAVQDAEQDNAIAVDLKPQLRDIGILVKEIMDAEDEQQKNDNYTKVLSKLTELDIGIDELANKSNKRIENGKSKGSK